MRFEMVCGEGPRGKTYITARHRAEVLAAIEAGEKFIELPIVNDGEGTTQRAIFAVDRIQSIWGLSGPFDPAVLPYYAGEYRLVAVGEEGRFEWLAGKLVEEHGRWLLTHGEHAWLVPPARIRRLQSGKKEDADQFVRDLENGISEHRRWSFDYRLRFPKYEANNSYRVLESYRSSAPDPFVIRGSGSAIAAAARLLLHEISNERVLVVVPDLMAADEFEGFLSPGSSMPILSSTRRPLSDNIDIAIECVICRRPVPDEYDIVLVLDPSEPPTTYVPRSMRLILAIPNGSSAAREWQNTTRIDVQIPTPLTSGFKAL